MIAPNNVTAYRVQYYSSTSIKIFHFSLGYILIPWIQ